LTSARADPEFRAIHQLEIIMALNKDRSGPGTNGGANRGAFATAGHRPNRGAYARTRHCACSLAAPLRVLTTAKRRPWRA